MWYPPIRNQHFTAEGGIFAFFRGADFTTSVSQLIFIQSLALLQEPELENKLSVMFFATEQQKVSVNKTC